MSSLMAQMEVVCYGYIAPVICWVGILTNILNLVILTRRHMKGSAYSFLTALAVTDMGKLVVFLLYVQVTHRAGNQGNAAYWSAIFNVYIVNPGLNMFGSNSVWIIAFITVDRYIAVRWPLKAKFFCCRKYARCKILFSFILAVACNSLRVCQYKVSSQIVNETLVTVVVPTELRTRQYFTAFLWSYAVIVMYIPCTVLLAANSYLLIRTRQFNRKRQKMMPSHLFTQHSFTQKASNHLSVTLVVITFSFIVCILPSAFSEPTIAFSLFGRDKSPQTYFRSPTYLVHVYVANLLVLCNSSLNFFLYCAFNQHFSETMKHVIRELVKRLAAGFERRNSQTKHIIASIQLSPEY